MWTIAEDGSVLAAEGKVICFSTARFVSDICMGECCFICGASPGEKEFNNEHIFPEWLLRRYDLFARTITLPNGAEVRYDRYTVPCCAACNTLMGDEVERPISEVIHGGEKALSKFVEDGNLLKLFVWMGLIYLKTHLKDRLLRFHLDARKGDHRIADQYDWEYLHHIHSIVRCFYTGCIVEREAIGSFIGVPIRSPVMKDPFDFGDLYLAQTMMLRLGEIAMVAVFNDSGGAFQFYWQRLRKITGPISELQLRELMADFAYLNLRLRERPEFHTDVNLAKEECRIVATRPKLELMDIDLRARGALLYKSLGPILPQVEMVGRTSAEVLSSIESGNFSLLFDDNGEFIKDSWVPLT